MPRDANATRRRLVAAAVTEFAAHGLAGGRVDRIAAAAAANKRAIYDYFADKEGLFDVALATVIDDLTTAVPLTEGDVAGYAADLFDYLQANPETVRLIAWRRLERPQAESRLTARYVEAVVGSRDRAHAGTRPAIGPIDLVILAIGLANAWDLSAVDLVAAAGDDPTDPLRVAAHRDAVVEAAHRLTGSS